MAGTAFEWDWKLLAGTLISFFGGALCAGSGIGGGAFYLSAFILVNGLDAHDAVPLSKVTILGLAIGGFLVLMKQRHPKSNSRALIDYDVAMILQPTVLLGSVGGVLLNVVSPTWLIVLCLVSIFGITAFRAIKKGIQLRKKEAKEAILSIKPTISLQSLESSPSASPSNNNSSSTDSIPMIAKAESSSINDGSVPEVNKSSFIAKHKEMLGKGTVMVIVLLGMFLFIYLKGGSSGTSLAGVECGSIIYWSLIAAIIPYMLLITFSVIVWLRKHPKKPLYEGDLTFTPKQSLNLTSGGLFAGVVSSFLGVGGGIVVGPLLLDLGLVPQVATSTSSFMLVFMAFSSTFQYMIIGKLPLYLGLWYFGVGFLSAIVGQLLVVWMIKKTKKQSHVDFFLAGVIIISCLAMVGLLVMQLISDFKTRSNLWFHGICKPIESSSYFSSFSSYF